MKPVQDLGQIFRGLPANEQVAVINYFNLHNAAIWIYGNLSKEGVEYVNLAVQASVESQKLAEDKRTTEEINEEIAKNRKPEKCLGHGYYE